MKKYFSIIFVAAIAALAISFTVKADRANSVQQTQPPEGLTLGYTAPEIALKSPKGDVIKLSSLRGKIVLIDFWASWCGPCRRENPAVVKAYSLYHDKPMKNAKNGFTIYSVSLDQRPDAWQQAILQDQLTWTSHVSDLMGWNSEAAAKYGVNSIPTNFLINEKGVIINRDLRGEGLVNALEKLVVK